MTPPIADESYDADSLQQGVLNNLWIPTINWSEIAEDGARIFTEGQGTKIKDVDGVWRYDASAGLMLVTVGHGRQEIVDAISEQLSRLHYVNTFQYSTPNVIAFAEKLATLTPGDLNRVQLLSGGSEAVETALKIAYQYHVNRGEPGRPKCICTPGFLPRSVSRSTERWERKGSGSRAVRACAPGQRAVRATTVAVPRRCVDDSGGE